MKILMVCLGNICRSPIAHGIMEAKVKSKGLDWQVDSAGTSGWHDGEQPDRRAITTAKMHGIDMSHQRSRRITKQDIQAFDVILTMDMQNYKDVLHLCHTTLERNKVHLIRNYVQPEKDLSVPDPYYDGKFEEVYVLLDEVINGIIPQLLEVEATL